MAPSEAFRPQADRLAVLLSGSRGAEILAEMQRLRVLVRDPPEASPTVPSPGGEDADDLNIGIWRVERTGEGTALRRRNLPGINPRHWANATYVPPAGAASRVVLIGESVARGWGYDPALNPAMALARHLERAAPGGYQCVDLAQAGAQAEEISRMVDHVHALEPDIVIMFAGNNWGCFPLPPPMSLVNDMADGLREGGYAAMRERFLTTVVLPRARRILDGLLELHTDHGAQVLMVIPEINLRGWAPPEDIDVPVLPGGAFCHWHKLREQAECAVKEGRWADVVAAAEQMRVLDDEISPVPGQMIGNAGLALGDPAMARAALEASRGALVGLNIPHSRLILAQTRELLAAFARDNGFPCVNARNALASSDVPELPDACLFFDYCHLSDQGIERVMSRVADTILGLPPGTTPPGPGVEPPLRAFTELVAAALNASYGQPAEIVTPHLRAAADVEPQVTTVMTWLLDVLEGAGPMWARPAVEHLAALGPSSALFGNVLASKNTPRGLWTLRACLGEILGTTPTDAPAEADLIADPFTEGHKPPNLAPGRVFYQATARHSSFAFGVSRPLAGLLDITYRMPTPAGSIAAVLVNDEPLGTVPASPRWATARMELPPNALRVGVNWLHIHWPVPDIDAGKRRADDVAAIRRGEFPYMLPVFGELFDARVTLGKPEANAAELSLTLS